MGNIFGSLRLADNDYVFNSTAGQQSIFSVAREWVAMQNAALAAMMGAFVEATTEDFTRRYKLPGSGYLDRMASQSQAAARKAANSWDISLPLEEFGAQIAGDRVSMAYMTADELTRHLETVTTQNVNTVRREILRGLFNNAARTFVDEIRGSLTVQPLANGDSVTYPPLIGADDPATANHYLASGYATASISNTNDPIPTITRPLIRQFGQATGGQPIAVFVNYDETAKLAALANFIETTDPMIQPGANTDRPINLPVLPGVVIGRYTGNAWIVNWDWIPSGYMLALHLGAPAPLLKRRDPAATGLPADLALVSTDAETPFAAAHWSHRFGIGAGNRLNGVVMKLTTGSYDVPTAYQ